MLGQPDLAIADGSSADLGDAGAQTIAVVPTEGLQTSETGSSDSFTIVLTTAPTSDVRVNLHSSDSSEGTVAPASLVFTSSNWSAPQTITVTGVDDVDSDGRVAYSVVTEPAISDDLAYLGADADDVSVINVDNETADAFVNPIRGLVTHEDGTSDTFSIALTRAPSGNVSISFTSSATDEATVSPNSVMFTPSNWAAPQTITVAGVDDNVADGDMAFSVISGDALSTDPDYNGLTIDDVSGTNFDDETAGIGVSPSTGLTTTESGGTSTFAVSLRSEPTATVQIPIVSTDASEGTVDRALLSFTTLNWNVEQVVTVTGVDDSIADGDQAYSISLGPATSADPQYDTMPGSSVSVVNSDDETAGVDVAPSSGLVTTESGASTSFTVVLRSEPTANVNFSLTSTDLTEGTVSPGTLTFTNANWATPQTVTVTGADDPAIDGNIPYEALVHVSSSLDASYAALVDTHVGVTNTDNETPGINVTPTSGLTTTEALGTDVFQVVLNAPPTADVSISLASDALTEGTAAPASLTFTVSNWSVPQTVTVTGVDDSIADGTRVYHIVTSASVSTDLNYNGIDPSDVAVTNADNDVVGALVSPTTALVTTEAGGTATFAIVLLCEPLMDVTFGLASTLSQEGTAAPPSVTFTPANWSTPQTITVTGVDDFVDDGDVPYSIAVLPGASGDLAYNGLDPDDVAVTNIDDDTRSVTAIPTSGLLTTEAGGTATFTLVLGSEPTADVSISLSSSLVGEGTVLPASVTFTSANWSMPQTITLTGVNDSIDDGNVAYTILTGAAVSADSTYNGLAVADVSATNVDDDTAGVTVTPVSGLFTTEAMGSATFTVVLTSQPTANVTVNLMSSDATEGSVAPASVVFTSMNWSAPQTVTVTGVDDMLADWLISYSIVTSAAVSADATYSGMAVSDVSVKNIDNELPYVENASVSTASVQANGDNYQSTLSRDGRYLIFDSLATNLVASADTNGTWDVFLRDMTLGTTIRISENAGTQANLQSHAAGFSPDNRYVAFYSDANNLVVGDSNGTTDIFLYDRMSAAVTRISLSSGGAQGNAASGSFVYFTDDGRYATFGSLATNLVAGDTNGQFDTFMRDLMTNTTTRISLTNAGTELNGYAAPGGISGDGRYFCFASDATNAIAGDTNAAPDIFVRDLMLNTVVRASVDSGGAQGNADSYGGGNLGITQDGRYIVFMSQASNLVAGDTNGNWDAFVRDRVMGTTTRVSVSSAGVQGNNTTFNPLISLDGSTVVFTSAASNLVAGDTNGQWDVFARHLGSGVTLALSINSSGGTGNGESGHFGQVSVSSNGAYAAFHSFASDLSVGDANGVRDIFRSTIP